MKNNRFYTLMGLIVLLLAAIPLATIVDHPELKKPQDSRPENPDSLLPRSEIVYRDRQNVVTARGDTVTIRSGTNGQCRVETGDDRVTSVRRLRNKPAGRTPLLGIRLDDGLKLTGAEQVHVVQTQPSVRLIASYPNPKSGEDKIIINKTSNTLFFYQRGELAKSYRVATGKRPEYTPEGVFHIARKTRLPGGNGPEAIFGPRWMGLAVPCEKDRRRENDARAPRGDKYGIHGTNEPDSIGTYASGGCIRLDNRDILELYEMVAVGTTVEITR